MTSALFLGALLTALPVTAVKNSPPVRVAKTLGGVDRTLLVTDATTATEVRLAPPGQTTTLTFPVDIDANKILLVDPKLRVFPPLAQGQTLALVAKDPLPAGATVPLVVTLVDGTQLQFALKMDPQGWDRFARIELQLNQRAGVDNANRLKTQLQEAQGRLDDCQQTSGEAGIAKLASIILKQDLTKADAFTVEKRSMTSGIDKQNRLLVETHFIFRLFDLTYLVITAENRDPAQTWVLERAELSVTGGSSAADIKILGVEQELNSIPPGETSKIVIAFRMPQLDATQRFTMRLLEKNGPRHVEMKDLRF